MSKNEWRAIGAMVMTVVTLGLTVGLVYNYRATVGPFWSEYGPWIILGIIGLGILVLVAIVSYVNLADHFDRKYPGDS